MLKRFFPLILSSLLLALALPCNAQNKLNNPFLPSPANVGQTVAVNIPTLPQPVSERLACYSLSYARAKDVQEALAPHFGSKLGLDTITNSLILLGDEQSHARLRQLLPKLDVATRQVTLEAKIIAVSREDSKNLGVRWDWDTIPQRAQETNNGDSDSSNYDGSFKFWRGFAFRFNATLNTLINSGKARILATPRIITIPGKEASIFIGDHIPVQTEKHDSSASVHTEVSTPVLISELKNYRITSRTADTNVRMYSGETLVIGGLISEEQQRTMQKVPFLSKIPLLGELFKNRSRSHSKTEVLLLLTPHITEAGSSPAIYNDGLMKEEGN